MKHNYLESTIASLSEKYKKTMAHGVFWRLPIEVITAPDVASQRKSDEYRIFFQIFFKVYTFTF